MNINTNLYYAVGLLFFLLSGTPRGSAQSTIGAASGGAVLGSQLHAWSLAEMCAVSTLTSPTLIVSQGFLQPADALVPITEADISMLSDLKVFPNPSSSILQVAGQTRRTATELILSILDARGALLWEIKMYSDEKGQFEQIMDLGAYPAGTYVLRIFDTEKSSTYTITKL